MADLFTGEVELVGEVRDVLFENADNGYAVIRLGVRGRTEPVTVTGTLFGLAPGSRVRISGNYRDHPRFGRQLLALRHEEILPRSVDGMVGFLSSQFRGIGPKLAERIVETFGERTYEVLDADPGAIGGVPGVGKKKAEMIGSQWEARKGIREAATFLAGYGVGPGQVARVFRHYGDATVGLVRSNPYRLADDIAGIGFRTADRIAQNLGIPKDSEERARAGVLYLLGEASAQGHLLLPVDELARRAGELELDEVLVRDALERLAAERAVFVEDSAPGAEKGAVVREVADAVESDGPYEPRPASVPWNRLGPVAYLRRFHIDEKMVASMLRERAGAGSDRSGRADLDVAIDRAAERAGIAPTLEQKEAVRTALLSGVGVLTGGPGTGKTTITRILVDLLAERVAEVRLAAPTGRAAKRLSEATGRPASTIHRLLGFDPFTNAFIHGEDEPLDLDHLVVDECSMMDVPLAAALLRALPERAGLTLVGDADQLPSVGPGDFFRAVCASDSVPVVRLHTVFRQKEGSKIVAGAHAVNQGRFPGFDSHRQGTDGQESGEFFFVELEEPEQVAEMIRTLVVERIPTVYGFDSRYDVQVLTPMHKGAAGAENLNALLGAALNPHPEAEIRRGDRRLRTGDRIVQVKNDYEKHVFNGDQGFVVAADPERGKLVARFDDREVTYERDEIDRLLPAWATTVHRAQGGEHPAVVVALCGQHYPLLRRNLVYTAITRARRLCVVVGSRRALERAIRTDSTGDRYSWLEERLAHSAPGGEER